MTLKGGPSPYARLHRWLARPVPLPSASEAPPVWPGWPRMYRGGGRWRHAGGGRQRRGAAGGRPGGGGGIGWRPPRPRRGRFGRGRRRPLWPSPGAYPHPLAFPAPVGGWGVKGRSPGRGCLCAWCCCRLCRLFPLGRGSDARCTGRYAAAAGVGEGGGAAPVTPRRCSPRGWYGTEHRGGRGVAGAPAWVCLP